jgi:hypothetical protein
VLSNGESCQRVGPFLKVVYLYSLRRGRVAGVSSIVWHSISSIWIKGVYFAACTHTGPEHAARVYLYPF